MNLDGRFGLTQVEPLALLALNSEEDVLDQTANDDAM